jgi:hypothetical protein
MSVILKTLEKLLNRHIRDSVLVERLHISKQPTDLKTEVGMLSIWKYVGDPILDMRFDHTTPIYDYSKAFKVIINQDYWRIKIPSFLSIP